jgi:arylamine N-acetyltransferase
MPLTDNHISNWGATEASNRLIYQAPSHPIVQGLWTLQHRISEKHDWTPLYVFGMTEFFPRDFEVMNFATSARNTSFFTYRVICAKMVIDEEVDDIVGLLALEGGRLKRRIGAVTEDLIECRNEEERVGALKEHFGIDLGKSEIDGIKRTVTELTGEN